jgi:PAS domain S-box-containing protein
VFITDRDAVNSAVEQRHLVSLCIVAGCVSAILGGAAHLGTTILSGQARIEDARVVQRHLRQTETALFDMETSQRGYLLTLDPVFLDAYRQAGAREDAEFAAFLRGAAGRNRSTAPLDKLTASIQAKRAEMDLTLDRAREGDVGGAQAIVKSGAGRVAMDRLRQVLADVNADETRTVTALGVAAEEGIRRSLLGAAVLGALAAIVLGGVMVVVGRARAARRAAEQSTLAALAALRRQADDQRSDLDRSSQALRLSEAHLAGIIDTASAAILTVDSDQKIVIANQAATVLFGIAHDELIGAPLERLIPARFRESHAKEHRIFSGGEGKARRMGRSREVLALRANGEEFPIEAAISRVHLDASEWFTVVLQDISERRDAEAALLASKWKLEAALSSMNDAVVIADANGRSYELNHAYATFYRFANRHECLRAFAENPEFLEVTFADGELVPPDQWVVRRALRGETASNVELGLRRKDTGERWIGNYSFAPIRAEDGHVVGAVATSRDVTEMRAAQVELARSRADLRLLIAAQDRIQEEERKRIARELHDDLQQTLAVIRIDLGTLGDRLAADQADLGPLVSEADRMAMAAIASTRRIVNDLRPAMLEELGLVAAMSTMARKFAERTGTACAFDGPDEGDGLAIEDPALTTCLYRVTQEALNNVAKHAQASAVRVSLSRGKPGSIRLRISDDGVGMQPSARHGPESFGLLGMAERVRAIGGQLRIQANQDAGTTIEVLAPIVAPTAATMMSPLDASAMLAGSPVATMNFDELAGDGRADPGLPLQAVVNALDGNVAVLDRSGTIRLVNRAWCDFAERNGVGLGAIDWPGTRYLEACRVGAEDDLALVEVVRGIGDVLDGSREHFSCEYPCDMPNGRHWFRMHVASVTRDIVIVNHVDLGRRIAPELENKGSLVATAAIRSMLTH